MADVIEIVTTAASVKVVTVTWTVVVVVVVEHVSGVVVRDEDDGGVELMRSEWTEYHSEQLKPLRRDLLAYVREIETTETLVAVTPTVVVAVVVDHAAGVLVRDEYTGGVELMKSEWSEHPSEQRKPLHRSLLVYVREIETTETLVTVTPTVVVVVVVVMEHVTVVVLGINKDGRIELMKSEWRE